MIRRVLVLRAAPQLRLGPVTAGARLAADERGGGSKFALLIALDKSRQHKHHAGGDCQHRQRQYSDEEYSPKRSNGIALTRARCFRPRPCRRLLRSSLFRGALLGTRHRCEVLTLAA